MYIKTRVFSFKFVNKYYSTLDPSQRTGTLLVPREKIELVMMVCLPSCNIGRLIYI